MQRPTKSQGSFCHSSCTHKFLVFSVGQTVGWPLVSSWGGFIRHIVVHRCCCLKVPCYLTCYNSLTKAHCLHFLSTLTTLLRQNPTAAFSSLLWLLIKSLLYRKQDSTFYVIIHFNSIRLALDIRKRGINEEDPSDLSWEWEKKKMQIFLHK